MTYARTQPATHAGGPLYGENRGRAGGAENLGHPLENCGVFWVFGLDPGEPLCGNEPDIGNQGRPVKFGPISAGRSCGGRTRRAVSGKRTPSAGGGVLLPSRPASAAGARNHWPRTPCARGFCCLPQDFVHLSQGRHEI